MAADGRSRSGSQAHPGTGRGPEFSSASAIRVVIVDDDPAIRAVLRLLLRREPDLQVVGEAADGLEAIERVAALRPDVVVMDAQLPRIDGIEATRRLNGDAAAPPPRVVLLAVHLDRSVEALQAGAFDCLCKAAPRAALLGTIRQAAAAVTRIGPLN